MKVLLYLLLLGILGAIVWLYPFLFELFILGTIGGAYWLFFRTPKPSNDQVGKI